MPSQFRRPNPGCGAFPQELRRLIETDSILKVGCGFVNDGKVIHESVGINVRKFVEVGMMVKFSEPERYAEESATGLSLERCVKHVFNCQLDKTKCRVFKWDSDVTPELVECE